MDRLLIMNGPNLDMLGTREPEIYGTDTLDTLEQEVATYAESRGLRVAFFQSNSEGALIERIHAAADTFDGIVYNPGAHTHYSYALRDAIGSIDTPVVEVHLSAVDEREPFRHVSVIAPACVAQVKGLGIESYCRGVDILLGYEHLQRLGEGYERDFPAGQSIVFYVDGCPVGAGADEQAASSEDGSAHATSGDDEADRAETSRGRIAKLQAWCAENGADAFLVRDTSNIRWLTAFDNVFDSESAHALFVDAAGPATAALHTDSRYSEAARLAAGDGGVVRVDVERCAHAAFAQGLLAQQGEAARLAFEDGVSYAEYLKLADRFASGALLPTSGVVVGLRAVKDAGEIARMRFAQSITDAAFSHIIQFMKPGMTEREVQLELEDFMMRHGAEGLAFPSIVASGANGASPHAIPGATRLEAGQCVVMDFGAKARGYCSDMTRTVFLGEPTSELANAYDVLRQANEQVEAMLRPGVTGIEAHNLAEKVLADGGYEGRMGHGLGHGVGIDVHEEPCLNTRNDKPLAAGNVVTVEPGIYIPGSFGMRLEDFGVVTDSGFDVFTQSTHDLVVL